MTITTYSLIVPAVDADMVIDYITGPCGTTLSEVRYEGDTVDLRAQVPLHMPPLSNLPSQLTERALNAAWGV